MLKEIINALVRLVQPGMTAMDVEIRLDELALERSERLAWRTSIVDLMKVLNLDSSLTARKALAEEMGYSGKLDGSAAMNNWLHAEVLRGVKRRGIPWPGYT